MEFYERERVQDALDAGANGYLVKSVDAESLAHAVRSVARGQGCSPRRSRECWRRCLPLRIGRWQRSTSASSRSPSSSQKGRTNAEIAKQLGLSIFTVKNHVSNVLTKLHAQTRTEAAATVLNAGRP